jgi:carbon-monoxide dehydrogenase medium subunit
MYAVEPREYLAPLVLDDALAALDQPDGASVGVLAGGQSLVPLLRSRQSSVDVLLDLNRIAGLGLIESQGPGGDVRIGATVRYREIGEHPEIARRFGALADAASSVGDVQVRNRGTIGGSLAWADATSDLPTAVAALRGRVEVVSRGGTRVLSVAELILGARQTALRPGELISGLVLPAPAAGSGSAYLKYGITVHGRPVVGVAAAVTLDPAGRCTDIEVVVSGLRSGPHPATAARELVGGPLEQGRVAAVAAAAAEGAPVHDDLRGSAEYRRHLVSVYIRRAVRQAADRAVQEGK